MTIRDATHVANAGLLPHVIGGWFNGFAQTNLLGL
jgi:hypothetical protein